MQSHLPEGPLRSLLLEKDANQLEALTSGPSAYAPSPVEGGLSVPQPFPEDMLADLRKPQEGKPLEARVFASIVNYSLVFKLTMRSPG